MTSSPRTASLVAALGVTLLVLGQAFASAQVEPKTAPKQKDSAPKDKVAKTLPMTAPLQTYDGEINPMVVVASRKKNEPAQDTITELKTFSLRVALAVAWNDNRTKQEAVVRQYLEKTLELYDVSVKLAESVGIPKPGSKEKASYLIVNPAKQTLTVKHTFTGHTMSGWVSVPWWFDAELKGTFDLELVMSFDTRGPAAKPLVLKSTKVFVRNFKHPVLDISASGEGASFTKASFADVGTAKGLTANVNGLLGLHTGQTGLGVVTPGQRMSNSTYRLVFELSKAPPVVSPK